MSADDSPDGDGQEPPVEADEGGDDGEGAGGKVRDRLGREADRAAEGFDEGIVDLLSWVLDTETRARIYVYLRRRPDSTSEEVADGTGLYPSTVRETLAALHADGLVDRRKRESEGAGNNPYEYAAIAPSELVTDAVGELQSQLNAVFTLDRAGGEGNRESGPVTITVEPEEPSRQD
jgi:predicted transcriptional regulator